MVPLRRVFVNKGAAIAHHSDNSKRSALSGGLMGILAVPLWFSILELQPCAMFQSRGQEMALLFAL